MPQVDEPAGAAAIFKLLLFVGKLVKLLVNVVSEVRFTGVIVPV